MADEHKKKKISATIDRKLLDAAEALSKRTGVSVSRILENALKAELARDEEQIKKTPKAKKTGPKLLKSPQAGKDIKSA